ncbi:hypothetical protein [Thermophilibacter sp.]
MSELLSKISAYDLLNIALPGIVLGSFSAWLFPGIAAMLDNPLGAVGGCYIAGVVASRVGSLFVERVGLRTGMVRRRPYASYIKVSRRDSKLEGLSAVSNMYRTLTGSAVLMLAEVALRPAIATLGDGALPLCCAALALLLYASWTKQEHCVSKRIKVQEGDLADEQD